MSRILEYIRIYLPRLTMVRWQDWVEIFIISFLIYHMLVWIKQTKAWTLLKGLLVIVVFLALARALEMNTILWIAEIFFPAALTVIAVILQPELRQAVEGLGRKRFFSDLLPFDLRTGGINEGRFSDKTINEIARACEEMGRVKTGALIVIEQEQSLADYERTGIDVDGIVTSQLLINIFEKNTPLHDGAVIVRGNRVTSATCYLPLSDNMELPKDLGTRHRAGIGISEATDSMTVIVSEETGMISVAYQGHLTSGLNAESLKEMLRLIQNKSDEDTKGIRISWKGIGKSERETDRQSGT